MSLVEAEEEEEEAVRSVGQAMYHKEEKQEPEDSTEDCPSEFECTICMKLLYCPVSTPCGHNFCKTCIEKSISYRASCPICRRVLIQVGHPNRLLADLVKQRCPRLTAARRAEIADAIRVSALASTADNDAGREIRLPVFHLSEMRKPLFPNQKITLLVFERRYVRLVEDVSQGSGRFIVIPFSELLPSSPTTNTERPNERAAAEIVCSSNCNASSALHRDGANVAEADGGETEERRRHSGSPSLSTHRSSRNCVTARGAIFGTIVQLLSSSWTSQGHYIITCVGQKRVWVSHQSLSVGFRNPGEGFYGASTSGGEAENNPDRLRGVRTGSTQGASVGRRGGLGGGGVSSQTQTSSALYASSQAELRERTTAVTGSQSGPSTPLGRSLVRQPEEGRCAALPGGGNAAMSSVDEDEDWYAVCDDFKVLSDLSTSKTYFRTVAAADAELVRSTLPTWKARPSPQSAGARSGLCEGGGISERTEEVDSAVSSSLARAEAEVTEGLRAREGRRRRHRTREEASISSRGNADDAMENRREDVGSAVPRDGVTSNRDNPTTSGGDTCLEEGVRSLRREFFATFCDLSSVSSLPVLYEQLLLLLLMSPIMDFSRNSYSDEAGEGSRAACTLHSRRQPLHDRAVVSEETEAFIRDHREPFRQLLESFPLQKWRKASRMLQSSGREERRVSDRRQRGTEGALSAKESATQTGGLESSAGSEEGYISASRPGRGRSETASCSATQDIRRRRDGSECSAASDDTAERLLGSARESSAGDSNGWEQDGSKRCWILTCRLRQRFLWCLALLAFEALDRAVRLGGSSFSSIFYSENDDVRPRWSHSRRVIVTAELESVSMYLCGLVNASPQQKWSWFTTQDTLLRLASVTRSLVAAVQAGPLRCRQTVTLQRSSSPAAGTFFSRHLHFDSVAGGAVLLTILLAVLLYKAMEGVYETDDLL